MIPHIFHPWGVWQPLVAMGRIAVEFRPCLRCEKVQFRHVPTLSAKAYAQLIIPRGEKLNGKEPE